MKNKISLALASMFMAVAIVVGALSAHALKPLTSPENINSIHTAVFYMIVHSLAIFLLVIAENIFTTINFYVPILLFIIGIFLFSISIIAVKFLQIFCGLASINLFHYAPPFGGISFVLGWVIITYKFFKK